MQLYEKVSPGVVAIRVLNSEWRLARIGFVFDNDGHIVTNYHVIENQVDLEMDFLRARNTAVGLSARMKIRI